MIKKFLKAKKSALIRTCKVELTAQLNCILLQQRPITDALVSNLLVLSRKYILGKYCYGNTIFQCINILFRCINYR